MIEIRFPDQSLRTYAEGTTPFEIAQGISEGLARNVLSAKFNDQVVEASTPLLEDGNIQLFTWNVQDSFGDHHFLHRIEPRCVLVKTKRNGLTQEVVLHDAELSSTFLGSWVL